MSHNLWYNYRGQVKADPVVVHAWLLLDKQAVLVDARPA